LIRLLYLVIVFLTSLVLVFHPHPLGQVVLDGLILLGVFLVPFYLRRRQAAAQILEGKGKSHHQPSPAQEAATTLHPLELLRLRSAFDIWALTILCIFLLSFLFSRHLGLTHHAVRQLAGGILLYSIFSFVRLELDSFFDFLIGILWAGWLIYFMGPVWEEALPWLWAAFPHGIAGGTLFAGETSPVTGMTIGAVALEAWVAANLLVPRSRMRRGVALLVHTLLWAMWGALDSLWLSFASLSAFLLTSALYPKRSWWRLLVILIFGVAAFGTAARWSPLASRLWQDDLLWNPPFASPVYARDFQAALQSVPTGRGAGTHPVLMPSSTEMFTGRPFPGGQQIAWLSELGFAGPILCGAFLWLLVWSLRFVSQSQWERFEPTRDPEALHGVKETELPLGPIYLPATLFGWILCSVAVYPFDLFRSSLFWVYLGLWVGWLTVYRQEALSTMLAQRRKYRLGGAIAVALLLLLLAGSREAGRGAVRAASRTESLEKKENLLQQATARDPLNPAPLFQLAEVRLLLWRQGQADLDEIRENLERGISRAPLSPRAYRLLSRVEEAAGNLFAAIEASEKAVELAPADEASRWRLAGLYESAGRAEAAGYQYKALLQLSPSSLEAYLGLARTAEKERRLEDARKIYRQALLLDRGNTLARQRLKEVEKIIRIEKNTGESS
jgi:hypothetical protein